MSTSYGEDQKIELTITTWSFQPGDLFEYNSTDYLQRSHFRSVVFNLPLPKKKPIYYFFHLENKKPQYDRYQYILERRNELKSDLSQKDKELASRLKLMGGVKLYIKNHLNKKRVFAEPIQASRIERVKAHNRYEDLDYYLPFLVVRTFSKGYPLRVNQLVRFGKVQYQITELNTSKEQYIEYELQNGDILNVDDAKNQSIIQRTQKGNAVFQTDSRQCKVCYGEQEYEQNALIAPCDCKGSGMYIHIECLRTWIQQKLKKMKEEGQGGAFYQTNLLFCQICKQKFPKAVVKNGKQYGLLRFLEQTNPYIALKAKQSNQNQNLFYISFQQATTVKIGRLIQNGVILQQQSVSRKHAQISLDNKNRMILEDTESKYGTMIYEKDMEFKVSKRIKAVQQGNAVYSYKIIDNHPDYY